jgi:hypothetical protein
VPSQATGLIAKHQSNYATAIAAYNDKRRTWDHLSLETLARPMEHVAAGAASDAVVKARRLKIDEQIGLWHDALGYEKENRQHLEPPALAERVRLVYRQALNCLRFLPDMWYVCRASVLLCASVRASFAPSHHRPACLPAACACACVCVCVCMCVCVCVCVCVQAGPRAL